MTFEEQLDRDVTRRNARDADRFDRWCLAAERAEPLIGELVRDGRSVFYTYPPGGKYREGSKAELIDWLVRYRYV